MRERESRGLIGGPIYKQTAITDVCVYGDSPPVVKRSPSMAHRHPSQQLSTAPVPLLVRPHLALVTRELRVKVPEAHRRVSAAAGELFPVRAELDLRHDETGRGKRGRGT